MHQAYPSYGAQSTQQSHTLMTLLAELIPPPSPIALAEAQSRLDWLNLALDIAQVGFWAWDFCTAKVYSTPLCDTIMGFEPAMAEHTYQDWRDRIHPEDVPFVERTIQTALEGQEDFICQCRVLSSDRTFHWVECRARSYYDEQQRPRKLLGTISDITDRKRAELALWDYTQELAQVNRLLTQATTLLQKRNEELDQFAYVVSHDLKAPLRGISNLSEWIEEDMDPLLPPENREQLHLLRQRVYRMEGLIDGLLEYSRIGRTGNEVRRIDLQELLPDVIDSLSPPPEFLITISPDMPVLQARRLPLIQVFSNLIGNAIKHHGSNSGRVQIGVKELGAEYEFSIEDDGPGIAPEHHDRIYGIFQTLKSRDRQESTGIGLAIVKRIIEVEGGKIRLTSALGQGTTFYFTWPKTPRHPTRQLANH